MLLQKKNNLSCQLHFCVVPLRGRYHVGMIKRLNFEYLIRQNFINISKNKTTGTRAYF
jgi:hypothetical protein